jgi:hypothetical protein
LRSFFSCKPPRGLISVLLRATIASSSTRRDRTAARVRTHRMPFGIARGKKYDHDRRHRAGVRRRTSRPVSRVLFPAPSVGRRPSISAYRRRQAHAVHPQARTGRPRAPARTGQANLTGPSRPCSGWGLPSRADHPARWWSLTPPFHPYRPAESCPTSPAVCFLWHCPAGHPGLPLATTLPCGARTFLGGAVAPTRPPGRLVRRAADVTPVTQRPISSSAGVQPRWKPRKEAYRATTRRR